jgi:para-nitrobenzyl esterase
MRIMIVLGILTAAVAAPSQAQTQSAPAAQVTKPAYSVSETPIGTLLDNPDAKAVLDKHLPGLSSNPQIDGARAMTLSAVAPFSPDTMTEKVLADIQADLDKLPVQK